MTSSLFRKEALEHRKDKLYGDVLLLQPLSLTVLVGVVLLICTMILAILFWGTYARKELVHGYLVPDKGIVKIYSPQPGTVSKVHVREGDEVKEGQVLITVLSERSIQGGNDIDALKLHEIESTQAQQLERIAGEKKLLVSETSRLKGQIESLKTELEQIDVALKNQEERLQITESRVNAAKKIAGQSISQTDFQKLHEEWIVQKQGYQELLRTKGSRENSLSQTHSELEQLPIKTRARITEIENSISELKQRHADVEGHRILEIRAPIAGTISSLQSKEGQWLASNVALSTPLLAILPKDALMQAELYVPSRSIGFVEPGQTVRVRYDAFPHRRFGVYEGKVLAVSKHVLLPSELTVPIDSKEPVYRVTVDLQSQNVNAYGREFSLQAGMSLEADMILEKQTLIRWLLDPVLSLRGKF